MFAGTSNILDRLDQARATADVMDKREEETHRRRAAAKRARAVLRVALHETSELAVLERRQERATACGRGRPSDFERGAALLSRRREQQKQRRSLGQLRRRQQFGSRLNANGSPHGFASLPSHNRTND